VVPVALHPEEIAALRVLGYLHRDDAPDAAGLGALFGGCSPGSGRRKRGRADKGVRTRVALVADPPAGSGRRRPHPRTGRIATARRPGRPQVPASSYRRAVQVPAAAHRQPNEGQESGQNGGGGNPARHLTRPHQPAAPRREPARLALTSRRNTTVTTRAPRHALHQDQRHTIEDQPWPVPDPRSAWRKISLTNSPPTPPPSRSRNDLNRAKLEIPIDRRRSPAGSCLGGFRTPALCRDARPSRAGIRKPSP
jgi:hypothetical protein